MDISLQTASQEWTAHVLHPGPFMTHVSVTWEESSYLRYYENGTLVTEVPAMMNEGPSYPNTSLSVFVDLPFQWVHEMKLYNEALTPSDAYNQYASSKFLRNYFPAVGFVLPYNLVRRAGQRLAFEQIQYSLKCVGNLASA